MKLNELIGQEFDFYGVDGNFLKIGELIFEAVEDNYDGYRSHLDTVEVPDPHYVKDLIFHDQPFARVQVQGGDTGYEAWFELVDVQDQHRWLWIGTLDYDSYYPCFGFQYHPKPAPKARRSKR